MYLPYISPDLPQISSISPPDLPQISPRSPLHTKQVGERKRSLIDANTKWKADPERVRERMLLIQMLLNTDPLLPANLDKKDAVGKLSAVEMRRKSDDDVYPWVATIVALTLTLGHGYPNPKP